MIVINAYRPLDVIYAYWKEVLDIHEDDILLYPCVVEG